MQIEIRNEDLLPLLQKVIGVVERRSTMPILGHIHLAAGGGAIQITATDLEIEIEVYGRSANTSDLNTILPARKLTDISRALPLDTLLRLRIHENRALISAGRSRFTLLTLGGANFPRMEIPEGVTRLQLPAQELRFLLDKTAFAMAHGDVRYYLNGLLFVIRPDELVAVATDGHRMAKARRPVSTGIAEAAQIILPGKTVQEMRRLAAASEFADGVTFEISDRSFAVSTDRLVVRSKIIDGRYPDYARAIPAEANDIARVNREVLREALTRTAVLSTDKYKGVRFTFTRTMLTLQAQNPELEVAEEELEYEYDGAEHTIGFNGSYVLDVLNVISDELVEIAIVDSETSTIWRGLGATDETFVIMPMRL